VKLIRFALTIAGLGLNASYAQEFRQPAVVSDFLISDVDGRPVHYTALKGSVTVVIFFSTRCPISNAFNYRRNNLYIDFKKSVKFMMIESNSNESLIEMQDYARGVGFDFPVYRDTNHDAADRLGAKVTTDTFVLDSSGAIRYHGYLEDSPNPSRVKYRNLRLAIEEALSGMVVAIPETKALGCTIRRAKL
jgi:AhpC/TSA family